MAYNAKTDAPTTDTDDVKLSARWTELKGKRDVLDQRCYDYAMWTLPSIFPRSDVKNTELQGALDSIGARAVNNLSNKLVMTMFGQPFFRLMMNSDLAEKLAADAANGDPEASQSLSLIDTALVKAEKNAMQKLETNGHRTQAIMAAKGLIITGNALMYYPPNGKVQTYSLKDYCVVRDLSGNVIEIMTIDKKALNTFSKETKELIQSSGEAKYKKGTAEITIYTKLCLEDDGKFHLYQNADDFVLDSSGSWPVEDLPWIPLTWNLIRGEDYGRGLVEDYAGAFHALYVLAQAEVNLVGIAADIKFLVDPGSTVDVKALNDAESGTYHSGKKDDIFVIQINKIADMEIVEKMVQRLEQQIGAAFMLQSATTRDAERVTAEEVKLNAQELDISNGGIYSRFADEWQYPIAVLMLKGVNIKLGNNKTINPVIITGLDSLSRSGELDALHALIGDLALLGEIQNPQIIMGIDISKYIAFCAVRRGVDYQKFMKSAQQMQQEAQAQQQQQQAATAQQMAVKAAPNLASAATAPDAQQ